uniref:FP protein C-terminal domain-containing protein n=1 Tax=Heliothis virescens TaxID=7102 RepID=A0A2A4JD31_HELVI
MNTKNSTYDHIDDDGDTSRAGEMSIDGSLIEKESPPPYVTFRKGVTNVEMDLSVEFKKFQAIMKSMLENYLTKHDEKFTTLLSEFEGIKSSIQFISNQYDSLEENTKKISSRVSKIEEKISSPQAVEPRIAVLEAKLEAAEQKSRNCNVEISNLPEKRGENLISILENISILIKQPVLARDVITIHRVPLMNSKSTRPRNIVVKLSNQILRDNFIAAARLKKGITTEELKMNSNGNSQKIFINEHLTLHVKKLFRQTKEAAKENGHRFVWIKHGTILVRADTSEPAFTIRSEEDLSKIKPYKAFESAICSQSNAK